ncbi:hypothetical protein CCACVL1_30189 [Corchorus capsularis]|uniref:Uncharacterized protein n=1 Tax=Corchorus capsularis TaxID=210143 RepID=A0A1R3FYF9_COCAP|nr:hypothetical protein CCACVL1_30189 [Corchorus capsularis]
MTQANSPIQSSPSLLTRSLGNPGETTTILDYPLSLLSTVTNLRNMESLKTLSLLFHHVPVRDEDCCFPTGYSSQPSSKLQQHSILLDLSRTGLCL